MQRTALGFLAVFSLWFLACGGKVVIDAEGQGGAGGTGSASVGSSSGTGGGTGGSTPFAVCTAACDKLASVMCGENDCVQGCLDSFKGAGDCAPLLTEAAQCIALHAGEGGVCQGASCKPLLDEFASCVGGTPGDCSTGTCSGGPDGSCSCGGLCNGSNVQVSCFPTPSGFACACNKDGLDIGKCEMPNNGTFACDLQMGCCASFF